MEYRRLGKAGIRVSELSFGSWVTFKNQLDVGNAKDCMVAAYDAGVNFFDNAEGYAAGQSEVIMGKVLKDAGWPRDTFVVSSKVFFGGVENPKPNQRGLSAKHVYEACHAALKRLQVDYLDLYFCHRPDAETPIEETVRTMHHLIQQGKVLYWGTSEWPADLIMEAYGIAREYGLTPPTMEQPEYNLLHRRRFEVEYARLYSDIGLGTTIWSPLASGLLTGKYNGGVPAGSRLALSGMEWLKQALITDGFDQIVDKVKQLSTLAADLGAKPAQLAIAWCLVNPHVSTVITGASRVEQVKENMKAADVVPKLTPEVLKRIEVIFTNGVQETA